MIKFCNFVEKCYILMLAFFPILIIAERYIPLLGSALTGGVMVAAIVILLIRNKNKTFLIKYAIVGFAYYMSLKYVTDLDLHNSYLTFLIFTMLVYDLCRCKPFVDMLFENFYGMTELIEAQLWICLLINLAMVFVSYGYSTSYTQIWSLNAYQGIYVDPHQLGYRLSAMIVILNALILIKNRPRYIILLVAFEGLVLLSGARVPAVMAMALGLLAIKFMNIKFVSNTTINFRIKEKIIIALISIIFVCSGIFVLSQSSFVKKIQVTLGDEMFDSGRSDLKDADLEYFSIAPRDKQLFGSGTEKTYQIHKEKVYAEIWSHNDFLQILVGMGAITVALYTLGIFKAAITLIKRFNWIYLLNAFGIVFLAWGNGLFIHPRFVCVIPLLIATIDAFEKRGKQECYVQEV
ncbi:hypothetical protein [Intestinibacter sp.]